MQMDRQPRRLGNEKGSSGENIIVRVNLEKIKRGAESGKPDGKKKKAMRHKMRKGT